MIKSQKSNKITFLNLILIFPLHLSLPILRVTAADIPNVPLDNLQGSVRLLQKSSVSDRIHVRRTCLHFLTMIVYEILLELILMFTSCSS